jgi:NAD(P)-dependent dehydrogenase (short-subunit alcohol dehydrogenase family)
MQNKIALITGGASGITRSVALHCARKGYNIRCSSVCSSRKRRCWKR